MELIVTDLDDRVPGIRTLRLADPRGHALPSFTPGSHLMVRCGETVNAYSLTGEAAEPGEYTISVLRVEQGAGGSRWIHDTLRQGDHVETVGGPRSAFAPVRRATKHLLIGGGIGITPLIAHLRSAVRWKAPFEILYAARPGRGAYRDEIARWAGERATFCDDGATLMDALERTLVDQPLGTHLYVCGPGGLMDRVTTAAVTAGWPASRIHTEHFGLGDLEAGDPFDVTLDGERFTVPSGVSLLETLERRGRSVPNLCRQGVCGECRIPVRSGEVLHRDLVLTEAERTTHAAMMSCVSRAVSGPLEVVV